MEESTELGSIKTHLRHHKIALYGVLILLIVLTYGIVLIFKILSQSSAQSSNSSTSSVAPETQYANPFDKDSQYTNPFASYKNPFDSLK